MRAPMTKSTRPPAGDPLDPHGEIARRLRALYAADSQEPIPSDLIALLERLDEAEMGTRQPSDGQAR